MTTKPSDTENLSATPLPIARTIVLVGLMGAGKSTIGRRLAQALQVPFCDSDDEIEEAAGMSISEIFTNYGESEFRALERRVIARLMEGGPQVLATGGGAFMNDQTRALIKEKAISLWLRADLKVLVERVSRRNTRPLLQNADPAEVLSRLMTDREPIYALADLSVESNDAPHEDTVEQVLDALRSYTAQQTEG